MNLCPYYINLPSYFKDFIVANPSILYPTACFYICNICSWNQALFSSHLTSRDCLSSLILARLLPFIFMFMYQVQVSCVSNRSLDLKVSVCQYVSISKLGHPSQKRRICSFLSGITCQYPDDNSQRR